MIENGDDNIVFRTLPLHSAHNLMDNGQSMKSLGAMTEMKREG